MRRKTINSVKELLSTDEVKFIETKSENDEFLNDVQKPFKRCLNSVQKCFKNNAEKYEYLIANDPNNKWITEFKQTKEYQLLYAFFFNI